MITNTDAQQLVDGASVRVLITAADAHGRLRAFADRSSYTALSKKPEGWRKSRELSVEDIRPDNLEKFKRPAWILSKGRTKVVALQHEWGIELLVGIAGGVGSAAVIGLTKLLWRKWQNQKKGKRTNELSVLRFQVMEKGRGKIRSKTIEYSGDLTATQIEKVLLNGFALVQKTKE
jgi:hypothetical protein